MTSRNVIPVSNTMSFCTIVTTTCVHSLKLDATSNFTSPLTRGFFACVLYLYLQMCTIERQQQLRVNQLLNAYLASPSEFTLSVYRRAFEKLNRIRGYHD